MEYFHDLPDKTIIRKSNDAYHQANFRADAALLKVASADESLFDSIYFLTYDCNDDHSPTFRKVVDLVATMRAAANVDYKCVAHTTSEYAFRSPYGCVEDEALHIAWKIGYLYEALEKDDFETRQDLPGLACQLEIIVNQVCRRARNEASRGLPIAWGGHDFDEAGNPIIKSTDAPTPGEENLRR